MAPLEGFKRTEWLRFESVVAVKDTYSGGVRTFLSQQDARLFRRMVYAQVRAGWAGGRGAAGSVALS